MGFIQQIVLDPFRLDITNEQLWHGSQRLPLRPQAFAVLRYLAEHPNRLISKEELLREVWRGRYVSASTIRGCIREIRNALQDSTENARHIETVGRKGYRFTGNQHGVSRSALTTADHNQRLIVGRNHDIEQLKQRLAQAEAGERQLILVRGEAGLGKSSLANLFIQEAGKDHKILVGRGRCVDQYGHSEAYLPIMDLLYDLLAQADAQDAVLSAMRRHAPSWLAQMTMFLGESERESLQQLLPGITQARLWQELNHLLITLADSQPLLLLIEDLHWCDTSTLELLAYLAQRQEPVRWLILGTYRQTEVSIQKHRLHDVLVELQSRDCCWELALKPLGTEDIAAYLHSRLEGTIAAETAIWLHRRTGGNPLFLINIVNYLLQRKQLIQTHEGWRLKAAQESFQAVPVQLQKIIIKQFEQLLESAQKLLGVASVCGETFNTAAVAAGLQEDVENIDDRCMQLARLGSLISERNLAAWPDGTKSGCFQFQHALYRQVIYERLGQAYQSRLHRRLAERMEAGYSDRASEIAGELALHFEKAQDISRAVHYYQLAAKTAADRNALHEVLAHSRAGLRLLATQPKTMPTISAELDMLILLGTSQIKGKGYASLEVSDTFTQAEQLCRQIDDQQRLILILMVLRSFHFVRGDMRVSSKYVQQLLELARQQSLPLLLTAAHLAAGNNSLYKGELTKARDYLHKSTRYFNLPLRREYIATFGVDASVICHTHRARTLSLLGLHDQAQRDFEAGLRLARELAHPFSLALALSFALEHYHFRGDLEKMAPCIQELLVHCERYGFGNIANQTRIFQSWLRAKQGEHSAGTIQLEQAFSAFPVSGNKLRKPYCIILQIDLYQDAKRYVEARHILEQSLAEVLDNALYIYHPELLRLRGELLLAEAPDQSATAERWFQEAIEVSRRQQARTLELRAAISLGWLWLAQGKSKQAHHAVKALYEQFSEGFDTADLRNAKTLLNDSADQQS